MGPLTPLNEPSVILGHQLPSGMRPMSQDDNEARHVHFPSTLTFNSRSNQMRVGSQREPRREEFLQLNAQNRVVVRESITTNTISKNQGGSTLDNYPAKID
jgi:DNA repair protein RadC